MMNSITNASLQFSNPAPLYQPSNSAVPSTAAFVNLAISRATTSRRRCLTCMPNVVLLVTAISCLLKWVVVTSMIQSFRTYSYLGSLVPGCMKLRRCSCLLKCMLPMNQSPPQLPLLLSFLYVLAWEIYVQVGMCIVLQLNLAWQNIHLLGMPWYRCMPNWDWLFRLMQKGETRPNYATIANVLPVCASLDKDIAYCFGKEIHGYVLRNNEFLKDVSIYNALVSFYLRVGQTELAELLFRRMEFKDLVSWNAIIGGYASNAKWLKALEVFDELLTVEMVEPDTVTFVSVLPACAQLKDLKRGRETHAYVLRNRGLYLDTSVANALINFYAKCDDLKAAYHIFSMITRRDIISWNSILDAFAGRGDKQFAGILEFMFRERFIPDSITILSVIQFCDNISREDKVKEAHSYSIRHHFLESDEQPKVGNAILSAYAQCGNIEYALKVFQSLSEKRNLISFNSMISSYVNHGLHDEAHTIFSSMPRMDLTTWNLMVRAYAENDCPVQAVSLFNDLLAQGMKPDEVTIMSLLPVCAQFSCGHLIKVCHAYVIRSSLDDARLKGALLDVYAKCGSLGYARKLFKSTPHKDLVLYTSMIGGYAMHGMGKEAVATFCRMLELGVNPDHVIITAVLSACSHSGLVNEGLEIFYSVEKVYKMKPTVEQYCCVVDLLARGGRIGDAYTLARGMPNGGNANVWGALLGACKTHHEVEMGNTVADTLFRMEANNIGNYVVLSNIFAADERWDKVVEVRKLMKSRDLRKPAGCSWIEVDRRECVFVSGDTSHPRRNCIYEMLSSLALQITEPRQMSQQVGMQLLDSRKIVGMDAFPESKT
ncbi:Putative pentatricopeptide repeat-containing protein At5g08490 [Linum perenne]